MKNAATDYKKLYKQSLKIISEKEGQLTSEPQLLIQAKEALDHTPKNRTVSLVNN